MPLQWALGLKRLGRDFVWLEILPAGKDPAQDRACIRSFRERLAQHGLSNHYCLLYQRPASDAHDLDAMRCHGLRRAALEDRLAGPNVLLNLSYSIHPPLLERFERRLFCDLDPGEISFWMTRIEMGQSFHHEFWSIGLNRGAADCRLPDNGLRLENVLPAGGHNAERAASPSAGRTGSRPSASGTGRTTSRWTARSPTCPKGRSSSRF